MGLFSGIKNNMRKTQAAVVLQNLFEFQAQLEGNESIKPAELANALIETAWNKRPEAFDGSVGGVRPHKLTIAVYSLANLIDGLPSGHSLRESCIAPFVRLIAEVQQNGALYSFNSVDNYLLEPCFAVYERLEAEMGDLLGEMGSI
ncbi:MAG: hypothetical protein Q7T88_04405 [Methylotenera sp.]|nr:hypothetical protein [Methylotenera sp.]